MKTIACLFISIVAIAPMLTFSQETYVSITAPKVLGNGSIPQNTTNTLELLSGQTAHLVSLIGAYNGNPYAYVYVEKDDISFWLATSVSAFSSHDPNGITAFPTPPAVTGPAKLVLVGYGGGLATFRISPNFTDPQKTAIVLPGADNAALVTMEYSTNLVDWFPATNGVYAGDVAKFFKIHLEKSKQ